MSQTLEKYTYDDFGNQTGKETYEVNMDAMKNAKTIVAQLSRQKSKIFIMN